MPACPPNQRRGAFFSFLSGTCIAAMMSQTRPSSTVRPTRHGPLHVIGRGLSRPFVVDPTARCRTSDSLYANKLSLAAARCRFSHMSLALRDRPRLLWLAQTDQTETRVTVRSLRSERISALGASPFALGSAEFRSGKARNDFSRSSFSSPFFHSANFPFLRQLHLRHRHERLIDLAVDRVLRHVLVLREHAQLLAGQRLELARP